MSKVKVLFFAADPLSTAPNGKPRLRLDEDMRQIQHKVRASQYRYALDFDYRLAARPDDLIQALNETLPQVVHFSGHGNHAGLVLASEDGTRAHPADAAVLKQLFKVFRGEIRVVVLNACLSHSQAKAIAEVVGCAIGTRGSISDEAAITFGASFYRALAFGHSVKAAYDQARLALTLDHVDDRECPELVVRRGVDPAKLVLVSPSGAHSPATENPEPGAPPRGEMARGEQGPRPLVDQVPTPRILRRARMAAVSVAVVAALASGVVLLDRDLLGRDPKVGGGCDIGARGTLGIAGGLPAAGSTSRGAPSSSPAGAATASTDPAGAPAPAVADLAAAKDLYEAGNCTAALPLFQRAAEAGDVEAMGFLGRMYLNGQGTAPNSTLAVMWLRKAVDKRRDARAMHGLGTAYEMDRKYYLARSWYEKAVKERGYVPAMSSLARMYEQGLGVDANPAQALAWYRKAMAAGSVDAMVDVGEIFQEGLAGAPDAKEALRLYHAAAAKGSARGMVAIGQMYQHGVGVPQSYEVARSWYLKASAEGSAEAMNNLGVLYQNGGWGVEPDRKMAIRWYRRAADAGSTVAIANLAALGQT